MQRFLKYVIVVSLLLSATAAWAAPVQEKLYFTRSSSLSPDTYIFRFSLWTVAAAGDPLTTKVWEEEKTITLTSGNISTYLGSATPLDTVDFSQQYWVQVEQKKNAGDPYSALASRTKLNIVPYAMYSMTSEVAVSGGSVPSVTAGSGLISTTSSDGDVTLNVGAGPGISVLADKVSIGGKYRLPQGCGSNSLALWDGVKWICGTDQNSGGDITAVIAGTGLSGGALSGDATLKVAVPLNLSGSNTSIKACGTTGCAIFSSVNSSTGAAVYGKSAGTAITGTTTGASNGVYGYSSNTSGVGVYGYHSASTGTTPGVKGTTNSVDPSAVAVLGTVSSIAPGGSSTGVRGINNGTGGAGIGVWGSQAGSGYGVYGTAVSGYGVYGSSTSGRGVYGYSSTGLGVYAYSNGTTLSAPALYAYNANATAIEPAGIAIFAKNRGGDSTIVAQNMGTGDTFRSLNAAGNTIIYRVTSTGRVVTTAVQITGGGDLAEKFEVRKPSADIGSAEGMVVSIDPANPGKLVVSQKAYDRTVAGVISGAGGINSGMVMGQEGSIVDGAEAVALTGRVYVKADATKRAIKPGDLLTTSDIRGHAMKVVNHTKAQGAIIGKAMTGLDKGTGLVLVLVTLQ